MADDLFARFKGGSAPKSTGRPPLRDDDSGLGLRRAGSADHVSETEVMLAIERIPAMPMVVQELLARVGNAASNASDLEGLIKQDMAIAARLLKLVNSPFYGLGRPVSSLTEAVQIVGFSSLKCLVVAASTASLLAVELGAYGFTEKGLWRNSVATAGVARAVALRNGTPADQAEEYFAAGLLRDIGMLVIGPFLGQRGIALRAVNDGEADILRRERAAIGYDHCWVGERIAEKWSLPPVIRLCIGHHHRIPPEATPAQLRLLASVRLAERLTYSLGLGVTKDHPFESRPDPLLVQASGLDHLRFQELVKQVPEVVKSVDMNL